MRDTDTDRTLLADIGGTNTRVALAAGGRVDRGSIRRFANADHPDLSAVLDRFMADNGRPGLAGACVAAAGPVRDGVAEMTNLAWRIDRDSVARATGAPLVAVINDLQAQGHALEHLGPGALRPLVQASPAAGPRLVVGIGTGFNAAPVHATAAGPLVVASECGHASLPVRTESDLRLLRHVETAHGFPGVEDVLSGRGLERLYEWVATEHGQPATRSAAEIMAALSAGGDRLAAETAQVFQRLLGTVVGDLSLIHLPFGGVYLIGGVARAFTPWFAAGGFARAFRDKGRFSEFMDQFPVWLVEDDYAALEGCSAYLRQMAVSGRRERTSSRS